MPSRCSYGRCYGLGRAGEVAGRASDFGCERRGAAKSERICEARLLRCLDDVLFSTADVISPLGVRLIGPASHRPHPRKNAKLEQTDRHTQHKRPDQTAQTQQPKYNGDQAPAPPTTRSGSKCEHAPPGAGQPGPRFPYAFGRRLQRMRKCLNCVLHKHAPLHAPSLQPSWITALRRAICLLMLRMRRFGHRFRPWRRQIFLRTVGQMSVTARVSHPWGQSAELHGAHPRSARLR